MERRPRYRAPQYRPAGKLNDKVALITGADSGIGRAVAVLYASEADSSYITGEVLAVMGGGTAPG